METNQSEFNVTGVSVTEFKRSSGVGTVVEVFTDHDFNVRVDNTDADQLAEWVEKHGGEAHIR